MNNPDAPRQGQRTDLDWLGRAFLWKKEFPFILVGAVLLDLYVLTNLTLAYDPGIVPILLLVPALILSGGAINLLHQFLSSERSAQASGASAQDDPLAGVRFLNPTTAEAIRKDFAAAHDLRELLRLIDKHKRAMDADATLAPEQRTSLKDALDAMAERRIGDFRAGEDDL